MVVNSATSAVGAGSFATIETLRSFHALRDPRVHFCIMSFSLVAARAAAQEFAPAIGHTGIGRCHMDVCHFFVIEDAKPVGSTKEGTLFATASRQWANEYRMQDGYDRPPIKIGKPETDVSFVFCSKTKPVAFFFEDGAMKTTADRWTSFPLRPGDDNAVNGVNESVYMFYWAACHNFIA